MSADLERRVEVLERLVGELSDLLVDQAALLSAIAEAATAEYDSPEGEPDRLVAGYVAHRRRLGRGE